MATSDLTPARRRELKARAHALEPVVMIGDKGLSPAVLKEIDVNLKSHELIKIRVASDDRNLRESFSAQICEALGASAVQHIGKILVVYREDPERAAKAAAERTAPTSSRSAAKSQRAVSRASTSRTPTPRPSTSRPSTSRVNDEAPARRPTTNVRRPAAAGRAAKPARTPSGKSRSAGRPR